MTTETNQLPSEEFTPERMIQEERIAILKAVRSPGKTHSMIKNPELRRSFALELNSLRIQSVRSKFRKELSTDQFWLGIRNGMESTFWSLQKLENRTFVYEGRRVTWHLREPEDHRSPEELQQYAEFIEKVKEVHLKALKVKQGILADYQGEKISDLQKFRYLGKLQDQETEKIEQLRQEYGQ